MMTKTELEQQNKNHLKTIQEQAKAIVALETELGIDRANMVLLMRQVIKVGGHLIDLEELDGSKA